MYLPLLTHVVLHLEQTDLFLLQRAMTKVTSRLLGIGHQRKHGELHNSTSHGGSIFYLGLNLEQESEVI